jgi:hypothetical protein
VNEEEWLACSDARRMVDHLLRSAPTERKLRLFVAGFWRWQAARLRDAERGGLLKRVERTEAWAEAGRPPPGVRRSRSGNVIFFGPAGQAARQTAQAPHAWGREGKPAADVQPAMLRCVFNPFRPVSFEPVWRTPAVTSIARRAYEEREFSSLPVLADALEEAGCHSTEVLDHLRSPAEHVRGCWALDLIVNKQ